MAVNLQIMIINNDRFNLAAGPFSLAAEKNCNFHTLWHSDNSRKGVETDKKMPIARVPKQFREIQQEMENFEK
jgi:hypothetical protein